ncbi:NAD(P)H-dependent oxidoreductase [Paraburkholderia sp. CNPSo 3076]|uniref:NAD(P)H-dependent oxidoreductase n=1 Tax=Paraburkholderia sp. CNPSo 3076 TaxID=2940936 RepID=UPI00225A3A17|nr:NAD(P)H-dependent oxidoreductase [Paraburkholderia sp. CNPSo 3076]MCX5540011.1 NAD(P)H-dependent oxidoreductase [Paraburkholderia sp. CNPSo 3076]
MRILVIYCHPVATSFNAALHREVLQSLRDAGHDVDNCDLYAERFNPVLSEEERSNYHDVRINRQPVQRYVERLLWAEALVFCFPTWCMGLPAMLKGFFDRVMIPGVALDVTDPTHVKPALTHLKHIAAVVTYGRPRYVAWYMSDPPRRVIKRYLHLLTGGRARILYLPYYHMNVATPEKRNAFRRKVRKAMERFG